MVVDQPCRARHHCALAADGQPEALELVERRPLRARDFPAVGYADAVCEKGQRALRSQFRIELPQCSRSRIARVDEHLAAAGLLPLVQPLEIPAVHVNLAAHFQPPRRLALEAQRYAADGADVLRHVLPYLAVAARRGARQDSILVEQAERGAVELGFRGVLDRRALRAQFAQHACVKVCSPAVLGIGLRADRQHRHLVPNRLQPFQRRAADAQGRGIGRAQLGELLFEFYQFLKQPVVLGIGDFRIVLLVIHPVVMLEQPAKLLGSSQSLLGSAHENRRSASGLPGSMPLSASCRRIGSSSAPIAASARSSSALPRSSTTRPPRVEARCAAIRAMAS